MQKIDPEDIYLEERFGNKSHVYRIALIFVVLNAKFAKSSEGEHLYDNGYTNKELKDRAKMYFNAVHDGFSLEQNIYTFDEYIHNNKQLDLIRECYGNTIWTKRGEIIRPHRNTYYSVGTQVIAANFL